ncbi:hypothetical protein Gasu2_62910 [Galdieria sulphuraria]|nr:hypothetical protein Gasu2_62910 [Galdieria sulphuraria]
MRESKRSSFRLSLGMKTIQVFAVRRDSCIRKKPRNKKKALVSNEKQEASSLATKENVISPQALASKLKKEKVLGTKKTRQASSSRFKSPGIKRQIESCDVVEEGLKKLEKSPRKKTQSDIVIDACSVLLEGKGEAVLSTQNIQKELGRFGDIEQIVLSEDENVLNLPEEANARLFTVRMAKPEDHSLLSSVLDNIDDVVVHSEEDNDVLEKATCFSQSRTDSPTCNRPLIVYDEF